MLIYLIALKTLLNIAFTPQHGVESDSRKFFSTTKHEPRCSCCFLFTDI